MNFTGYCVSVRGASHEDAGEPCQDSARVYTGEDLAVAAVSDGHGSAKHFRSGAGSEIATRIAIRSLMEFSERNGGIDSIFRGDPENAARRIAANMICGWNEEIADHMRFVPYSEEENEKLRKFGGLPPETVYGATLIAAAATGRGLFGLQIGDGTFAAREKRGKMVFPMPEDERLVGNLTTSLCDNDAISSVRWFYQPGNYNGIVLSSDGLINSFRSKDDYLHFAERITSAVYTGKTSELAAHLKERSRSGSRDDISVAVLTRK
ncbi:MAG: protein phosphatase 2C domain-containing protein [Oscillospiraceae bacterium]|nr:protein phosphatase 2C domain-containing protein [Oscillospiraceae bacterium]